MSMLTTLFLMEQYGPRLSMVDILPALNGVVCRAY